MGGLLWENKEKESYLPYMISPPLVVGIHFPCCLSLFSMLQGYLGAAWQFLGTMKCHLGKNYLSYGTIEGRSLSLSGKTPASRGLETSNRTLMFYRYTRRLVAGWNRAEL